jgi:hypothetical protein
MEWAQYCFLLDLQSRIYNVRIRTTERKTIEFDQ